MSPTLSVVIVLYNSAGELAECLDSIAADVSSGWAELVLVDNASPDDSVAVARRAIPGAHVISLDRNRGFAGGVNVALAEVSGSYVLLLNPDVIVPEEGLQEVVAWMDAHPGVGAASPDVCATGGGSETPPRALPSVARGLLEASRTHKLLPRELRSRILLGAYWTGRDELNAGWIPGTAMFVRRQVIDEVGPLAGSLFMYGEDIEWCWRMRRAGYRIGVCASTRFVHRTSASAKRTWGEDASARAILSGVHQASRIMYGSAHARALAATNALALALEGALHGRQAAHAARARATARLWWELAVRGALPDPKLVQS